MWTGGAHGIYVGLFFENLIGRGSKVKGKLEMIIAMLIFGSIGVFVRNIDLPSLEIAFLRATIGGLFLICTGFLIKHKISLKSIRENAMLLVLSGAALGLNWVCLFQAYKYSTVSLATLSYYFTPLFIMVLSPTVLKEKLTKAKAVPRRAIHKPGASTQYHIPLSRALAL